VNLPPMEKESPPQRRVLGNGAVLLSRFTPGAHGVSLGVWMKTGSRHEDAALGGISHLLEHMVFKGTRRRGAFELSRDMEALGGNLDAFTTKETTAYTLRVLPGQLPAALEILAEMLEESTHPEDQLILEKDVVIEEILSSEDTPDDFVHERFIEHLFGSHPLSRPILGTKETVTAIGRDDLIAHMDAVHRGGNVVFALSGAITSGEIDAVAQAFHFPPGRPPLPPPVPAPRPAPGHFSYPRDLTQLYLEIGVPTVGMDHPDRYGLVLLANLLGGGMSSRLFQRVREQEGLAYSVYSWADFNADTGSLCTSLCASVDKGLRALEVVAEEYQRLRRGEVGEEEIEMNRNQVLSAMILSLEGSMHQMSRLAREEIYFGRFVPLEEMIRSLYEVDRDELVRLAETYLDPTLQTVVGHGPAHELAFA